MSWADRPICFGHGLPKFLARVLAGVPFTKYSGLVVSGVLCKEEQSGISV